MVWYRVDFQRSAVEEAVYNANYATMRKESLEIQHSYIDLSNTTTTTPISKPAYADMDVATESPREIKAKTKARNSKKSVVVPARKISNVSADQVFSSDGPSYAETGFTISKNVHAIREGREHDVKALAGHEAIHAGNKVTQ